MDYDDPIVVNNEIPTNWWMESDCSKYILSFLVHKDNKEISTRPTKLPAGPTRVDVRDKSNKKLVKERAAARAERPVNIVQANGSVVVEKYGDVDHQAKKARVEGMRSVIDKNRVDAIVSQIAVMRQTEDLYVKRMGREKFEQQMVNLVNQMPGMEKVQAHQGDAHDDDGDIDGDVHGDDGNK